MNTNTIVITGCSSGFGRVTALEFARRGWHVFATVRKDEDRASLLAEAEQAGFQDRLSVILCDITRSEQVERLAREVAQYTDGLNALLNNAGTAYAAPVELLSLDALRAQLEINLVAHVAVTQALLPLIKRAKGTIINVSSVGGRISAPITGAYAASKFALEAISDALRLELAPSGVRVVIIEPSSSPTSIWKTSMKRSLDALAEQRGGEYARLLTTLEKIGTRSASVGFPASLFADTVVKILYARRPHARYVVPRSATIQIILHALLPASIWDAFLRRLLRW
jgi:NAD(P)-dependent dehydrogenase (short-subunit alcohol dehydrogenase family)